MLSAKNHFLHKLVHAVQAKRELERRAANEASAGAGIAAAAQAVQTQRALKEAAQEEKRVKSPDEEAKVILLCESFFLCAE